MAQHAWLDSLSEDWVSQPRSDNSQIQLSTNNSDIKPVQTQPSRIPRYNNNKSRFQQPHSSSPRALSERSQNDINIKGAQLGPSKLSQELKATRRGRSASASTAGSVIHNSVVHNKSQSASPAKGRENVPEWRRRLVLGDLNYGESKDLFSSAGTGLENMFRPPQPPDPANEEIPETETTLPSSPPPLMGIHNPALDHDDEEEEEEDDLYGTEESVQRSVTLPKPIKFRPTEDSSPLESSEVSIVVNKRAQNENRFQPDEGPAQSSGLSFRARQQLEGLRGPSGQSDTRNEDFSPIFIGRHSGEDGKISYAPLELPANQLRQKLENLRRNQMILDPETQDDGEVALAVGDGTFNIDNTEDYARNGGFVNLQRGGRSEEGSFRHRLLSPAVDPDSELFPESSLQASTPKRFPTVRTERFVSGGIRSGSASPPSPSLPPAPYPSPEKRANRVQSTSPLKLFGPYDTFTNQTLLRRISQFEDRQSNNLSPSPREEVSHSLSHFGAFDQSIAVSNAKKPSPVSRGHNEIAGAVNNFGAGELNTFEFDGDLSLGSSIASKMEEKENVTPAQSRIPSSSSLKFHIHEDLSSEGESLRIRPQRHKKSNSTPARQIRVSRSLDGLHSQPLPELPGANVFFSASWNWNRNGSEGKRPRTSPSKDPTPKRQRILHPTDHAYGLQDQRAIIRTVQSSHQSMQTALTSGSASISNSYPWQSLAGRQILRPRVPTPNQRKSSSAVREPLGELQLTDQAGMSSTDVNGIEINGSRKSSMKTQDFFDAATAIMAQIRNRGRPKSALSSVEESNIENPSRPSDDGFDNTEDSYQESTREPFSRPPSRDGPPLSRMPGRQEDPQLADQLKKYEEHSEIGDIMTQSIRAGRQPEVNPQQFHSFKNMNGGRYSSNGTTRNPLDNSIVSDIPNIRISRNPDQREGTTKSSEFPSTSSRSSGTSTARSIPTGSSQGSGSRRLIAPDVVSQLIGRQVGNMIYNEHTKVWHKVKRSKTTTTTTATTNILPSEDSEEDPFASIPDLTVDLDTEKRNLGLTMQPNRPSLEQFLNSDDSQADTSTATATSGRTSRTNDQTHVETAVEDDKEIEHEITLHEDRMQNTPPSRRKNLTITFSSPIASIIHDITRKDSNNSSYESEQHSEQPRGVAVDSLPRGRQGQLRTVSISATKSKSQSQCRGVSRARSTERKRFIPRPVSRIDEQDENASVDGDASKAYGQMSIRPDESLAHPQKGTGNAGDLSVVMATPGPNRTMSTAATPIIGRNVGNLSLTPLSDFTIHQADRSPALEVSYVVDDRYLVTGDGSKEIMSKAVRNLVEKITEVEPFEPDWESIQELNISGKHLDTLHMLDRFCPQVVNLDVSGNSVSTLDGVPQSVRNLRMTENLLSELTAWRNLMNLQFVDISNNQITNLSAFKDLVHLRALRADNNQITSLNGVKFHDGLEVLRARGNLITHVDFDGAKMHQLTELDLEDNQIVSFENGNQLANLNTLNLRRNRLDSLTPPAGQAFERLRSLKISNNELTTFDLAITPSLRVLYADRNWIKTVTGFSHCRHLDSLSLREQRGDSLLNISAFIDSACEVRKIFLSGNRLTEFNPRRDFLNLQYLELANCGLQSLPLNLGELMPNLRTLNINFNAIGDLTPLRYIIRLKKLLAAGNRFSESGAVANTTAYLPHLARLDLRDNGITLGFYPPIQALVSVEGNDDTNIGDAFMLPDADVERYEKFVSRQDMNTRVRKRVYDMALLRRCEQLKMLDGLPINVNPWDKRDETWQAMIRMGVVVDAGSASESEESGSESDAETVRATDDHVEPDNRENEPQLEPELETTPEEHKLKPRVRFQAEPEFEAGSNTEEVEVQQPQLDRPDPEPAEPDVDVDGVDDELVNESALYEHLEEMSSMWEAENSFGP
ncbi:hypothetical protein F5Y16DRAFT_383667 [Xylariaceae sp. FL0255]|nr:hypothetical protein F5Y16DRAFT_383667 [Xylariaceae sp. FL0255]